MSRNRDRGVARISAQVSEPGPDANAPTAPPVDDEVAAAKTMPPPVDPRATAELIPDGPACPCPSCYGCCACDELRANLLAGARAHAAAGAAGVTSIHAAQLAAAAQAVLALVAMGDAR